MASLKRNNDIYLKQFSKSEVQGNRRTVIYKDAKFLIDSRYQIQYLLGKGSYGTVYSAIDTLSSQNGETVKLAIKKVSNIFRREVLLKRAVRELKLMRHFKGHRNVIITLISYDIVSLIDLDLVCIAPYEGLYCIQELADYDLARVIYSSIQFSEFHIQSFIYQILCGLKYIHSADVIHRDLKPGNILVTVSGVLKICDFGLARGISSKYFRHATTSITNYVATRWYRAPELMLSCQTYSKAVDIWAVGCILAELHGRRPLFVGKDQLEQLIEITRVLGSPSSDIVSRNKWKFLLPPGINYKPTNWAVLYPFASHLALDMIDSMVRWCPKTRKNVYECLDHPFLASVRDQREEPECDTVFDFKFEYQVTSIPDLKHLLQDEVISFRNQRSTSYSQ